MRQKKKKKKKTKRLENKRTDSSSSERKQQTSIETLHYYCTTLFHDLFLSQESIFTYRKVRKTMATHSNTPLISNIKQEFGKMRSDFMGRGGNIN
jgi:hypothetical protein